MRPDATVNDGPSPPVTALARTEGAPVPHFVATYRYVPGSESRLDAVRPEHRAYLAGLDALVLSGPTDDDGAVLVFEAGSAAEVHALLDADPFTTAGGLVAERSVVGWTIALGRARAAVTGS